jgi:SAM-dependent methyltransferase
MPSIDEVRLFWQEHPVADAAVTHRATSYDYFRDFDNLREMAEPYAFSNRIHGYEDAAGKAVLDYGCGNGYVLGHYARNGAIVHGVDLTEAAVQLARARFGLLGLEGSFVQGDGTTIPHPDETFDIVCSMGVLHHVQDPSPIVRELHRVLKPGGLLIAMLYHRNSFRYRVTFPWRQRFGAPEVRGRPLQDVVNANDGPDNPWAGVYSRAEASALFSAFTDQQFVVSKLDYAELALYKRFGERVLLRVLPAAVLDRLASRYGWNLYVKARRRR